jgi:hypothetical protein
MRKFDTGATRDTDDGKLKYEGFFSPQVLKRRAEYMHEHRIQADGELRPPDNWQKGMPLEAYMDSLLRHTVDLWILHRQLSSEAGLWTGTLKDIENLLCAVMFNAEGYLYELLRDTT